MTINRRLLTPLSAAMGVVFLIAGSAAQQRSPAETQYERGRAYLWQGSRSEGMKDLVDVANGSSPFADFARLEIARFKAEIDGEFTDAAKLIEPVKVRKGLAAPGAYVLAARMNVARSLKAADVDAAVQDFERVREFFPNAPENADAFYYMAELRRVQNRWQDALALYREVIRSYSHSVWAARARLGAALTQTFQGYSELAFRDLQSVIADFPGTPEANTARGWNTTLYRLHVRPPSGYSLTPVASERIEGIRDLAIEKSGELVAATREGIVERDATGVFRLLFKTDDALSVAVDSTGQVLAAENARVMVAEGVLFPTTAGPKRDIRAAVRTSSRELVLIDWNPRKVLKFSPGTTMREIATGTRFLALAVDADDDIAALHRGGIAVFRRDGTLLRDIPLRGNEYELEAPVDIAFDTMGHLYVLDSAGRRSIVVLSPFTGETIAVFDGRGKGFNALHDPVAMCVDAAGQVYVYDNDDKLLKILR